MGENSKIEWCDHTFNPWVGCAKVSAACTNCYAESWAKRTGQDGLWRGERRRTSPANWRKPLVWSRTTPGARVFCSSLADVFEDRDDLIEWRQDLMRLIRETPNLTWLLLTKRPEHMARWFERVDTVPTNVWVGTTVEDQQRADERIPHLLRVPAPVRFLSVEPMLEPVNLSPWLAPTVPGPSRIHWVIVGSESGSRRRPTALAWVYDLRAQCVNRGIPFFAKQLDLGAGLVHAPELGGRQWLEVPRG